MTKITELTGVQWDEVYRLRADWLNHGTSCAPADRPAAEATITEMYQLIRQARAEVHLDGQPSYGGAGDLAPVGPCRASAGLGDSPAARAGECPEAAHERDALAVEAHRARADHQQRRAAEAEEELARFAAHVSRYDELAEQAAGAGRQPPQPKSSATSTR